MYNYMRLSEVYIHYIICCLQEKWEVNLSTFKLKETSSLVWNFQMCIDLKVKYVPTLRVIKLIDVGNTSERNFSKSDNPYWLSSMKLLRKRSFKFCYLK